MKNASRFLMFAVAAFLCMAPSLASAGPATCVGSGFSPKNFHRVKVGTANQAGAPVEFYNWDFLTPTCAHHTDAEWPIDLIFWNNASRKAIKAGLFPNFKFGAPFTTKEFARINDGAGTFWANDTGKKTLAASEFTSDSHYRIYAYAEREYSLQWGYFVIGAMHRDYNEPGLIESSHFGNSESAEEELDRDAEELARKGEVNWTVAPNSFQLSNEEYGTQRNHTYTNNGLASMIKMP